jgi:hypothetical protein
MTVLYRRLGLESWSLLSLLFLAASLALGTASAEETERFDSPHGPDAGAPPFADAGDARADRAPRSTLRKS